MKLNPGYKMHFLSILIRFWEKNWRFLRESEFIKSSKPEIIIAEALGAFFIRIDSFIEGECEKGKDDDEKGKIVDD